MKNKILTFLLFPMLLTSCNGSGASFQSILDRVNGFDSAAKYPYYRVIGSIDCNNRFMEVDETFDQTPLSDTYVAHARYHDGFYNRSVDISENELENIVIFGMASHSYWLRAPLRLTKDNFYTFVAETRGEGRFNNSTFSVDFESGYIGSIGSWTGVKIALDASEANITLSYNDGADKSANFARTNEKDQISPFQGVWHNDSLGDLRLTQNKRENTTCTHYIISHIITSYMDQASSINPSTNNMTYELLSDGGVAFVGARVHTSFTLDNYPYYQDYEAHPELGDEWDEDDPLPCYKNIINGKFDIRLEYDKDGWLVKESATSIGYNYNVATDGQLSLIAGYKYKFN